MTCPHFRRACCFFPAALAFAGCMLFPEVERDRKLARVEGNPFSAPPPRIAQAGANFAQANSDVSTKVDMVTRKLLTANAQARLRPNVATIGSDAPEIFHQGDANIFVTEGLVKSCKSEAELAAVISQELAKMYTEREARTPPSQRNNDALVAPIDVPVGNSGQFSSPDMTHLAELVKFEKEFPKKPNFVPLPDPQKAARTFLEKAGYDGKDLTAVAPLLDVADKNYTIEKQFKTMGKQAWTP
jgi:hypothetical protein